MKILFLSQIVPFPPHGGVLQRGYNLIREIGRHNDVYLMAFLHPDVLTSPALVEESRAELARHCRHVEYFRLWPKESTWAGRLAYAWGGVSRLPFSVIAHRSSEFAAGMTRLLQRERIDLVHHDTLALAQFRHLFERTPCTLTHHNIESQLMQRRAEKESRLWARLYLARQAARIRDYEAAECGKFELNVVVSDEDAATLRSIVPELRTVTVANGVDLDYFQPVSSQPGPESPVLIYTGGMNMFANSDAVLYFLRNIWPLVKLARPDVKFYAVGQDPPSDLLDIARSDPGVVVTGYVDDIRPFVARASVYVVPLRVGGGTRLKVVDAMAMGKAIVSTRIGAEGLRVTHDREVLLADEPQQFAQATLRVLQDPLLRARLGGAGRDLVEREYSWQTIGGKLQVAYESVVAAARSTRAASRLGA